MAKTTKEGVYDGLPTTVTDINDQGINVAKTELSEWKDGAKIGSDLIEKEKETRPNGTIFINVGQNMKTLKDASQVLKAQKKQVSTYLELAKFALDNPGESKEPPKPEKSSNPFEKKDDKKEDKKDSPKDDKKEDKPESKDKATDEKPDDKSDKPKKDNPFENKMDAPPSVSPAPPSPALPPAGPDAGLGMGDLGLGDPGLGDGLDGLGPDMLGDQPLSEDQAKEVLTNVVTDLESVLTDLTSVEEALGEGENELADVLAHRKRVSRRLGVRANRLMDTIHTVIIDANSAINYAYNTLNKIAKMKYTEGGEKMEQKTSGLVLDDNTIDLFKKLRSVFVSDNVKTASVKVAEDEKKDNPFEKKEDKEEKEEKKDGKTEEKDEKTAAISDYPEKVDKGGDKYEKFERSSTEGKDSKPTKSEKEASAMPPTGARDLGDYGKPGGIETIELNTWWKDMKPSFEQMRSKEKSTDFTSVDGKVDILTGVVAKLFKHPLTASKSYYGVLKVGTDGQVQDGFVTSFADAAGDNQTVETYDRFTSPQYMEQLVQESGTNIDNAIAEVSGKRLTQAQMEGLTPGKTEKVNPLYDSYEDKKDSNSKRDSVLLKDVKGGKDNLKGYYSEAYGDSGYASDQVKNYKKAAVDLQEKLNVATAKIEELESKIMGRAIAEKAMHLARIAASRGVIPFEKKALVTQAQQYLKLDDNGYNAVRASLEAVPVVDKRALESYQIPEAENMQRGIIHNSIDAVHKVRIDNSAPTALNVDGLQNAVESNGKLSEDEGIQKHASVVPQFPVTAPEGEIPDFSSRFNTIGNRLRAKGEYDKYSSLLNRKRSYKR